MPATIQTQKRSGDADPRIPARRQEFHQLTRIQRRLEKRYKTILFDNEQLEDVGIVRGSPFDVDEDDPIDLDPRYFLPGPVEDMEEGLERVLSERDIWGYQSRPWPQAEPIKNHKLRHGNELAYEHAAEDAWNDARARALFCEMAGGWSEFGWRYHDFMPSRKTPWCRKSWPSPEDGRPCWQLWTHSNFYMRMHPLGKCSAGREKSCYNPDIPHAVVTIHEMARPLHERLLRSELLLAVCLLKEQIRWPSMYLDHHVYPVLVVCFHSRFSARILQAYFQNGKVVIRPSRLINLYTPTISPEVRLVIRWLNSRPVGDTRMPVPATKHLDDNAALPVEVTDVSEILSPMISVK